MNETGWMAFDEPEALRLLGAASDAELDALDFGVVEMDVAGLVRRYNATESHYSGLPPERVLGRHFFREVAPCCNNHRVAQRYETPGLDETIAYTFALRMKPVPVVLRMLGSVAPNDTSYLLVRWA